MKKSSMLTKKWTPRFYDIAGSKSSLLIDSPAMCMQSNKMTFVGTLPQVQIPRLISIALAFISFFVFTILPDQLQEKLSYIKINSSPHVHCKTEGFFGDLGINFTTKLTAVNFPSTGWLSYLRTQLKASVGRVCLQSKRIFLLLFS